MPSGYDEKLRRKEKRNKNGDTDLETNVMNPSEVFLDHDLHPEPGLRVHVRERKEICGPDEEVPVERVDRKAACAADAHHSFEPNLAREVARQFT